VSRSRFDHLLAESEPDVVRAAIVSALRAAVEAAGDSYQYGQPRTDNVTFGNDLWRFVWHEMGEQLGALPGATVTHPRNSFLVDLGPAAVYPFRYGPDRSTDVMSYRMVDSEFRRDLLVDPCTEPPLFWPEVVLVPYAANPNAGLVRAFVGGATIGEDNKLVWRWLEELDLGGVPDGGRRGLTDLELRPEFAQAPEPTLGMALLDDDGTASA